MKSLHWLSLDGTGGPRYGFTHQSEMQRAELARLGWTFSEDAELVVHVGGPMLFPFVDGDKVNVLLTHVEANRLSPDYVEALARYDLIAVGSTWAARVVREHVDVPVAVVPLGVDPDVVSRPRQWDGRRPFRFLWVGSPVARKGWELLVKTDEPRGLWWDVWHKQDPALVELYVKTSRDDSEGTVERWAPNLIVDSRRLVKSSLLDLYYSADLFLFPSYGEGFGLPLAEAMASGCPCIWTDSTGVTDFAAIAKQNRAGYPVPFVRVPVGCAGGPGFAEDATAPQANREAMSALMAKALRAHAVLAQRAKRAGDIIGRRFTWEASGAALDRSLTKLIENRERRAA